MSELANPVTHTETVRGQVRLFRGDSRFVLDRFEPHTFDFVLTDPPYGIDANYGRSELGHRTIEGDGDTELLKWSFFCAARHLKPDRWAAVFTGYSGLGDCMTAAEEAGLVVKTVIVWDKNMPALGAGIRNQYELIVLARHGDPKETYEGGNVWRQTRVNGRPVHPNEKPIPLLKMLIEHYCPKGGAILDPFMGSGTSMLAARDMGSPGVGIELTEGHYATALSRFKQALLPGMEG